ncbi:MAG: diphthine--ammonia ligase [bacterium]
MRVLLSWSGGKDSCMTLVELHRQRGVNVAALVTTVTEEYDRVSMHGVRRTLIERQAAALGLPLHTVYIPKSSSNRDYEARMEEAFEVYRQQGIRAVAFGDLFLADVRKYREEWFSRIRMQALFPIWHQDTLGLAKAFIDLGHRAVVTCVDGRVLAPTFAGRLVDHRFLRDLPKAVDPCGENGEFHTFVCTGPLFRREVDVDIGEVIQREVWHFCDLRER